MRNYSAKHSISFLPAAVDTPIGYNLDFRNEDTIN